MTHATPIDTLINPGNTAQRYVLWSNGRIDAIGAPAITSGPSWFDRLDQPVGVAIWITNWSTGAGYVFDIQGGYTPLNGATAITTVSGGVVSNSNGLPYVNNRLYIDSAWDPANNGQGYALTVYGELKPFGGAAAVPRTGARFVCGSARKLAMQFTPSKKAITMDMHGGLHQDFAGNADRNGPYWCGWDAARDIAITDWTATPNKGYILDLYGGVTPVGGLAATFGGPYKIGGDHARTLSVINASNPLELFQVWSNGQQFDYFVSTAPTVVCGNGVSEVQTVTITGTPTGGTFTLTFGGQVTAATAFNATASTVQTNLRALSTIGAGNVNVTGGPGPGTPYTVTFAGSLALTNEAQMTATGSFTGGASPAVTVATTIDGVTASPPNTVTSTCQPTLTWSYTDAQKDSQQAWQVYVFTQTFATANAPAIDTDPSQFAASSVVGGSDTSPSVRGVVPSIDLTNQGYKYYVRAQDTSGLWSAWASRSWTQNVPFPSTPTSMTATADQTHFRHNLSLTCTLGNSTLVCFQYSDDGGTTWINVRGADAVPLLATTTAADQDPPLGLARSYRAYTYSASPRVVSAASTTATATLTHRSYVLTSTSDTTLGGEVNLVEKPSWSRPVKAGVFEGVAAKYPTVVSDGAPKARKFSLTIDTNSAAEWTLVDNLVSSNATMLLRDPFGVLTYFRVVGDWTREQQRRAPATTELTPLRHAHKSVLPCVEVAAPVATIALLTNPPGPAG